MGKIFQHLKQAGGKLKEHWQRIEYPCSNCGHLIDPVALGEHERVGWCPECKQVFRLPLLKVEGWILAAVLLLVVKLQAGL